jgi:hypothetical protein
MSTAPAHRLISRISVPKVQNAQFKHFINILYCRIKALETFFNLDSPERDVCLYRDSRDVGVYRFTRIIGEYEHGRESGLKGAEAEDIKHPDSSIQEIYLFL